MRLDGRVAVVTGGGSGLGAGIVKDLAEMGAAVVVCGSNADKASEMAAATANACAYTVDLSDPNDIDRFTAHVLADLGKVDILVSNAGWDKLGPFVDSDPALWDRILGINLRAPIQLTHAFLPGMHESGWGRAVFVSSDAARVGSKGEAVYAAAKAGLLGFSKTIARESARLGVTSNVVCPGPSDTPHMAAMALGNERLIASLKRQIPLGRVGRPRDVAAAVSFLASERAEYITGQTISVSGGLTMV